MELCRPKIKRVLIVFKKSFSYILGNGTFFKKILIFQEVMFRAQENKRKPLLKSFLYFGK